MSNDCAEVSLTGTILFIPDTAGTGDVNDMVVREAGHLRPDPGPGK